MCGITGIFDLKGHYTGDQLEKILVLMRDSMVHRGPDDQGAWTDPDGVCSLGHRRLSIIDLSPDGRQPMSAEGVSTVTTFNGEIYNFQNIRSQLKSQGFKFKSNSDTEVLPILFRELKPSYLSRLNGMFAMAVWCPERKELLLARDAFGKKPLYIYQDNNFFAISSEMQAFYAIPGFSPEIDQNALAEYLMLGYLPGPRTIYENVRILDSGSFEIIKFKTKNGQPFTTRAGKFFHFHAETHESIVNLDKNALKDKLRYQLIQAVEKRMISDVPLGAFLSGGVDSSLVVAIVRKELGKDISTFSIGFDGTNDSEHEDAREIASHLGTNHQDEILKPDGIEMIDKIASILDQPNGDSSCLPTYLLSEFTRKHVTVALSGDGGDELFGGYGRYRDTMNELSNPELIQKNHGRIPENTSAADLFFSARWHIFMPEQAGNLLGGMPEQTIEKLQSWRNVVNNPMNSPLHGMRNIDARVYMQGSVLTKVDRMSMQHSLEVRCPMLDIEFAQTAMGLSEDDCWKPPSGTKQILKEIAFEYMPKDWMTRSKKGFGLPANAWAKGDILSMGQTMLSTPNSKCAEILNTEALVAMIDHQSQPNCFSIYQMWPMLILEIWLQKQHKKIAKMQASTKTKV